MALKLHFIILLALVVFYVEAGKKKNKTKTIAIAGHGSIPGFIGSLNPGGFVTSFSNVKHGLNVCRREDENGNALESEKCQNGFTCTSPAGGLTIQVGDVVNKLFFCNNPYPTPALACKAKNSTGHNITLPSSCACPEGKSCTGGPVNGKDILGKDITYYVCVKEATAAPKPDYVDAVLRRTCCGGDKFNFHMNTGGHTSSSSSSSSVTGTDTDGPGEDGSTGSSSGGRRPGRRGNGGQRRRGGAGRRG